MFHDIERDGVTMATWVSTRFHQFKWYPGAKLIRIATPEQRDDRLTNRALYTGCRCSSGIKSGFDSRLWLRDHVGGSATAHS